MHLENLEGYCAVACTCSFSVQFHTQLSYKLVCTTWNALPPVTVAPPLIESAPQLWKNLFEEMNGRYMLRVACECCCSGRALLYGRFGCPAAPRYVRAIFAWIQPSNCKKAVTELLHLNRYIMHSHAWVFGCERSNLASLRLLGHACKCGYFSSD
jgi:hypothetical protein